eukprot:c10191_g1_i2.p1 GENE.c10191_g1_i2~~c10191_g1_i2.p1  ORF type:complete len:104 (+),score=5.85 c10191_g1_i2:39-350(+)
MLAGCGAVLRRPFLHAAALTSLTQNRLFTQHKLPEPTMKEKLKVVMIKHGKIAVVFHGTVWISTLGAIYAGLRQGVDVSHLLEGLPFVHSSMTDPSMGTGVLA